MRQASGLLIVLFMALSLTACKGGSADKPGQEVIPPVQPAARAGQPAAEPEQAPVRPVISQAEVNDFLQLWLAAQNDGRFNDYQVLYASRMTGIRRSGNRAKTMDRAGWMADRGKMFNRKMLVEASDVEIRSTSPNLVLVGFTQTWSSGTYRDVGPKEMILVKEGGALRISREELLRSDIERKGAKPMPLAPGQWMPVEDLGGPAVIIASADAAKLGTGKPRLVDTGMPVIASQAVNEDLLSDSDKAMRGRHFVLYGPGGEVCRATVGTLQLYSRHDPHFGTRMTWDGEDGQPKWTDAEIADQAMSIDIGTVLAGTLVPEAGQSCRDAMWARDAALPPPAVFLKSAAPADLVTMGRAKFRAMKGYRDAIADVGQAWEGNGEYFLFEGQSTGRKFLTTRAITGNGCGDPTAEFWAIWEVTEGDGGRKLTLLTDQANPGPLFFPLAAADVDGDGIPEFFSAQSVVRTAGPLMVVEDAFPIPSFDCPC